MEIIEEFVNGFCKAQNQSRMVLCEFRQEADGSRSFLEADCAFGVCPHTKDCQLMSQVKIYDDTGKI